MYDPSLMHSCLDNTDITPALRIFGTISVHPAIVRIPFDHEFTTHGCLMLPTLALPRSLCEVGFPDYDRIGVVHLPLRRGVVTFAADQQRLGARRGGLDESSLF